MTSRSFPPVMILGCGRSGTSIFGEMFNYFGGYTYRSEPPFDDVMSADFSVPQAFKVPRECSQYPADSGLSFPISAAVKRAPKMNFFWIVRHPLDAVSSLRVGISNNWGHHPRPPDWQDWLSRPLVEQCAHHWAFINSYGFNNVSSRAHVVRFESMVSDPKQFAKSVCDILRPGKREVPNSIHEWAARVQNENNADFIEAETSRAYSTNDHAVRIGRWQENLSKSDIARMLPIVEETGTSFGYSFPDISKN